MTDDFRSLSGCLEAVWTRLEEGVHDAHAPARHLALATAKPSGGAAVRLLVLRGADRAAGTLTLFTHKTSDKVTDLSQDPRAELLLWDPEARLQARLNCIITKEQVDDTLWAEQGAGARQNYARTPLPGTDLSAPGAVTAEPDARMMLTLTARIETLDVLHLGAMPHARARYSREDDFAGGWIAP